MSSQIRHCKEMAKVQVLLSFFLFAFDRLAIYRFIVIGPTIKVTHLASYLFGVRVHHLVHAMFECTVHVEHSFPYRIGVTTNIEDVWHHGVPVIEMIKLKGNAIVVLEGLSE